MEWRLAILLAAHSTFGVGGVLGELGVGHTWTAATAGSVPPGGLLSDGHDGERRGRTGSGMDMREGQTLLLVGTMDGMMHAVSGTSGDLLWSFNSGGQVVSSSKLAALEAEAADALVQGGEHREQGQGQQPPPPPPPPQQQQQGERHDRSASERLRERPTPTGGESSGSLDDWEVEDLEESTGAATVPLPPLNPSAAVTPSRASAASPPPIAAALGGVEERHDPAGSSHAMAATPPPPVAWPEMAPPPLIAPPTRPVPASLERLASGHVSPPPPPSPPPLLRRPSIASWLGPKRKQTVGTDGAVPAATSPRSSPSADESSQADSPRGGQGRASVQLDGPILDGDVASDSPDGTGEDGDREDADADELLVVPGLDGSLFVVDDDGAAHPLSDHTVQVRAACSKSGST
jgi:hypothetical protein